MCKLIELTQGQSTAVNTQDYEILSKNKWYAGKRGEKWYAFRGVDDKLMHRVILEIIDPKIKVDHINGDTLDNRRENLRACSQAENVKNRSKQKGNKSGYKGVYWNKSNKCWIANISVDNKTKYLGSFRDLTEAAKAYDTAAKKYYGKFAKLNLEE